MAGILQNMDFPKIFPTMECEGSITNLEQASSLPDRVGARILLCLQNDLRNRERVF